MARRLLQGDPLSTFNAKATELGNETVANFAQCIRAVTEYVLPKNALRDQKRYMRRILRKPREMTIKQYFARYHELNEYLDQFPPFNANQHIPEDEIKEHAEFSIPNSWHKRMIMLGFDPVAASLTEFIEFCERIEFTKGLDEALGTKPKTAQKGNDQMARNNNTGSLRNARPSVRGDKRKNADYYCLYHGQNSTHNTDQCKVLQEQARRMSGAHASIPNKRPRYGSRTWDRSNNNTNKNDKNDKGKNEINAYIQNMVDNAVRQKLTKRKDPPTKQEEDLDAFNYADFEQLEISDTESDAWKAGTDSTSISHLECFKFNQLSQPSENEGNRVYKSLDECLNHAYDNEANAILSTVRGRPIKKRKTEHLSPIVFIRFNTRNGKPKPVMLKALIDSGGSESLLNKKFAKNLRKKTIAQKQWTTVAGNMNTSQTAKSQFTLPELHDDRLIEWEFNLVESLGIYDMIIGRDLLQALGLSINFNDLTLQWDDAIIPMKDTSCTINNSYYIKEEGTTVDDATECIKKILDAKYEKANLHQVAKDQSHLDKYEQEKLLRLLKKYENLFDGTLGRWTGPVYDIELKPGATPYHARSYPIPKVHEATLKMEVERLCKQGVLRKVGMVFV